MTTLSLNPAEGEPAPATQSPDWDESIRRLEARIEQKNLEDSLVTDEVTPMEAMVEIPVSELKKVREQLAAVTEERDGAYTERAQLLAWISGMYRAYISPALDVEDEGWSILTIHTMMGQLTWHIAPKDLGLFNHIPRMSAGSEAVKWDGHTTDEKYERIARIVAEFTRCGCGSEGC